MAKQVENQDRAWYVLHTYSGYEENVTENLQQRIESLNMKDSIFNVLVPKEKKIKILLLSVLMLPSALRIKGLVDALKGEDVKIIVGGAPFNPSSDFYYEIIYNYTGVASAIDDSLELFQLTPAAPNQANPIDTFGIGAKWAHQLPVKLLKRLFGILLIFLAIKMLFFSH